MTISKKGLVIITGASSGIGKELALLFARHNYSLLLVARDEQGLASVKKQAEELGAIMVHIHAVDLTKLTSAKQIMNKIEQIALPVEVLVNNAGFGSYGKFAEQEIDKQLAMIDLNIRALTELTGIVLPKMINQGFGSILQVASLAGFQPGPLMAVYYATKSYVLSFGEALYQETKNTGVTVTTLCPGATITEFQKNAAMDKVRLFNGKIMTASEVALAGYQGLISKQRLVIPGWKNKFLVFILRFIPRAITLKIVEYAQSRV